jgi:hypothetical protein
VTDQPALEDVLRGVSDRLLQAIREVEVHEIQKRGVPPGDERFPALATDVRVAAESLLELARDEERAAGQVNQSPRSEDLPPIAALPPSNNLAMILADWRAVERRLAAAEAGSPEAAALIREFEGTRDRYAKALAHIQAGSGLARHAQGERPADVVERDMTPDKADGQLYGG